MTDFNRQEIDMARLINTEKGFKVIVISYEEAKYLGFGTPEGCICANCNDIIQDEIYYIPALNDTMDKDCYDEWYRDATYYPEDAPYEQRNIDRYFKII